MVTNNFCTQVIMFDAVLKLNSVFRINFKKNFHLKPNHNSQEQIKVQKHRIKKPGIALLTGYIVQSV